jgi:AbrB family looped-hinge helix DNA binding protein
MTLKIDGSGRIILPKPLRDRLGLRAGSDLDLQETEDGFSLRPADRQPSMIKKEGLWVHAGKLLEFDIVEATRDERENRIRRSAAL